MKTSKHILVIAQYFYPEQFRINDICIEWVKRGYEVTVITGIPNYPKGEYFEGYGLFTKRKERYKGINIIRLPLIPRGHNSLMMVLNYFSFVVSGYFWSHFTKIKADLVFIYEVSPMTQALPGVWYAKRRKIPCFLYVMDLWPENVEIIGGVKNKFVLDLLGSLVDYIYVGCERIFTSSESFIKAIAARGVAIEKIEYWPQYAEDFYAPLDRKNAFAPEIPQDGVFNVIFAGNIGVAQGLNILPSVAANLKAGGRKIRFNIVGDGRFKDILIKMVYDFNVKDMFNFIDKQPPKRIPEFIAVCDATLISLAKNRIFEMTLPAKLQSCLACGKSVIVSADGEIQQVVKDSMSGMCCNAGDPDGLTQVIREMLSKSETELCEMGFNARNYYDAYYEKQMLLDRMDEKFTNIGRKSYV